MAKDGKPLDLWSLPQDNMDIQHLSFSTWIIEKVPNFATIRHECDVPFQFCIFLLFIIAPVGLRIMARIFYFQICWYKDNILGSEPERSYSSPTAKGKPRLQNETSGSK